ncbi:MAG: hypothetical protein ACM3PY_14665 [Omnitrophica WOR_2 bacterium]
MCRLRTSKTVLGLLILACTVILFIPVQPAWADIAPPSEPPGSNISPGDSTQVQMLSETVQIQVQPVAYQSRPRLAAEFALASVKAGFVMRNQGQAAEQLQVRFPLMDPSGMGDGFGNYPEIQAIQVRVNEKSVTTSRMTSPTPNTWDKNAPPISWAAFTADFPPGRKVNINVQYNLQPTGYFPVAEFVYILETGAGWYGPIGSADLTLTLPYAVNSQDLVYGDYNTTSGGQANGQSITWHYENLEPTRDDNLRVDLVAPQVWMDVLQYRQAVQSDPSSANAWRTLAQAAGDAALDASGKGWLRSDPGGQALALESMGAYEEVLALRPKDPNLWAEYENLMLRILMQQDYSNLDKQPTAANVHLQKMVEAVNHALALDPQNEQVQSDAQWAASTYPDVIQQNPDGSLSLVGQSQDVTETPQPVVSPLPSRTQIPTQAPTVAMTATSKAPATTPAPTTSEAMVPLTTPETASPSKPTEIVPASVVPAAPTSAVPRTFIAGAVLAGLCIIVLVALAGIGLAVWYTRHEKKPAHEAGKPSKKDETS